jgi:preprotein translocase subunit SecG
MIVILLTTLHVIVSVFLILVVLLQTGKKADLAGAFGGGGSQTAFGTRGAATLLSKLTTAAAVGFMVTSLSLSLIASKQAGTGAESILPDEAPPPARSQQVPTAPAPGSGSNPSLPPASPSDTGGGGETETSPDVDPAAPAEDPGSDQ